MSENDPVIIRKVANGFVVEPPPSMMNNGWRDDMIYVFPDFESLAEWLDKHFPVQKKDTP